MRRGNASEWFFESTYHPRDVFFFLLSLSLSRLHECIIYIEDLICSIKLTNKNDEWIEAMTIWLMGVNITEYNCRNGTPLIHRRIDENKTISGLFVQNNDWHAFGHFLLSKYANRNFPKWISFSPRIHSRYQFSLFRYSIMISTRLVSSFVFGPSKSGVI